MRIRYACLPCLVSQAVKVAELTNAPDREALFRDVFAYLSGIDFSRTNPEIVGDTYRMLKAHIGCEDPYHETRVRYDRMMLAQASRFEAEIERSDDPLRLAVKYAILGNIIDFAPRKRVTPDDVSALLARAETLPLTIDDTSALVDALARAEKLLYLGDNCGEICLDKLLIRRLKAMFPRLEISFGVRGAPVVNDCVEEDAHIAGMDQLARIVSNGDDSLGTVLSRVSDEFMEEYRRADVVIAKGQANYESLSEETGKPIFFLLMAKCDVISADIGVPTGSLVCKGINNR